MLLIPLIVILGLKVSLNTAEIKLRKDYFTALDDIASLIKTEHILTKPFLQLVKQQEEKLNIMERKITEIEHATPKVTDSLREITDFLGNPINSLKLLDRFTRMWPKYTISMSNENTTLGKCI